MKTKILLILIALSISFSVFSQEEKTKEKIKLERKNKRIAKRFVHPKSMFFSLGLGVNLHNTKMSKENEYFHRSVKNLSVMFSSELEIGHKDNFFYETGLTYVNYRYSYRSKAGTGINFYNGKSFEALKLYGGYGKRIILKNSNINLINVSTGFSLSFNLRQKVDSDFNETFEVYDKRFILLEKYPTSKNRVFPTLYLGLNKDIRIYKNVFLSLDYKFDLGFISTYEQEFEYYDINNPNDVTQVTNKINGTAQSFMIGIKTRFLADKYK